MKPSSSLTAFVIALAAPISAALPQPAPVELAPRVPPHADAWCTWRNPGFVFEYRVYIKEIDDVDVRCAKLWEGLAQHRFLCPVSKPRCEKSDIHPKGLEWGFTVGYGCDLGCVQSAFWEATKNKFGALDVSECQG